jgi:hypothetical protein
VASCISIDLGTLHFGQVLGALHFRHMGLWSRVQTADVWRASGPKVHFMKRLLQPLLQPGNQQFSGDASAALVLKLLAQLLYLPVCACAPQSP